jgi:methionyl-tRNA formyltransferase
MRVALFGSFYRGFFVLSELLNGPSKANIDVVGVATDDPAAPFVSAGKRVWRYGYSPDEANLVRGLAEESGIPVHDGRVKTPSFYELFENYWRPQLCIMATFGQMIDSRLFGFPDLGFYNLHPSDRAEWPSRYAGPDPFSEMIKDGQRECVLTVHHVDGGFDTGDRVFTSDAIPIPKGAGATDMHKISGPYAAQVVRRLVDQKLAELGRENYELPPADPDGDRHMALQSA